MILGILRLINYLTCKVSVKKIAPSTWPLTRVSTRGYLFPMRAYKEWWPDRVCNTQDAVKLFDTKPRKAKERFCINCPVRRDCLNYALLYKEHGVWGGTTETDRDQILTNAPQIYHLLKIEAIQAGILEKRYTIDQYWESVREARKLARKEQQPGKVLVSGFVDQSPALEELQALLEEWNIQ